MDEQDTSQLNADSDKIASDSLRQETESHKVTQEESNPVVYADPTTGNEVITIVSDEADGEVYIYERNAVENASAENPAEFVQVCDSNSNAFDEANSCEEKEVNVDEIEEEDAEEKREEEKEESEGRMKCDGPEVRVKEEGTTGEGVQSKNYKNVILEDWEVEVPPAVQNHDSENHTETVVMIQEPLAENAQPGMTKSKEKYTSREVMEMVKREAANLFEKDSLERHKTKARQEVSREKESAMDKGKESVVKVDKMSVVEGQSAGEANSAGHGKENSKEDDFSYVQNENSLSDQNDNCNIKDAITPRLAEKRMDTLKYPKSVTKEDIVKILDNSSERVMRPIVGGKDLFFSIELTKRFNQKLSLTKNKTPDAGEKHNESDSCNNNTVDDRQKIVEILEADEIKDWKSVPCKSDSEPKENGNDMEISKAIKSMEKVDTETKPQKAPRKTSLKKVLTMDKELERTLALQQLREEFPSTRKRLRTSKKINHVPFLASTILEKAMTSPEVSTALKPGPPKRRPCYLPENATYSKSKEASEPENAETPPQGAKVAAGTSPDVAGSDFEMSEKSIPNAVVKTYSAKRKSTDAESDIKTTLEAVAKALSESSGETTEIKPKKQKTGTKENKNKILVKKKRKLKLKAGPKGEKKMKSELEKLLGDEGAVRMLYDTQHGEPSFATPKRGKFKTTVGLKKDLVLKTKLVKNAVMRLSGVGTDGVFLRGKRRSNVAEPPSAAPEEEPLFSSTPNIVLYKSKKKQRAEASRILYRHSSSESFESSEGYRRTSFDGDGIKTEPTSSVQPEDWKLFAEADKVAAVNKGKPKKSEVLKKSPKNMKTAPRRKSPNVGAERLSTDSVSTSSTKLDLSNVPVRKSSRARMVSKKYSIWSSTSMDSLSVESLGLKKLKKASAELGKKLSCKELIILKYDNFVQIVLTPTTPGLRNSLNCDVLQELHQVFSYLSEDDTCRLVLLTSRGSTFCQGIDISEIIAFGESERRKGVGQLVKAIRELVTCLASFKKPVIAGVQGVAIGLGVTLLPHCDVVLCSDTALFYTPYVKLGQAPEGAAAHTFPRINKHLVSELLLKGSKLTAADAFKYGLVSQVIPEERFEKDLIAASRCMASQSVQGLQSVKSLLRRAYQQDISEALQAEGDLLEEHWTSSECLGNMVRFLESGELQLRQSLAP